MNDSQGASHAVHAELSEDVSSKKRLKYNYLSADEREQFRLSYGVLFKHLEEHFCPRFMDLKANGNSTYNDRVQCRLLDGRVAWETTAIQQLHVSPNSMALVLQAYFLTQQGMDVNVTVLPQHESFDIRCAHRKGKPMSEICPCAFAVKIGKTSVSITRNQNPVSGFELHTHRLLDKSEILKSRKLFNICKCVDENLRTELQACISSPETLPEKRHSIRKVTARFGVPASKSQIARIAASNQPRKVEDEVDAVALIKILERDFPGRNEYKVSVVEGQMVLEMAVWAPVMALNKPYDFLEITMDGSFNMEASRQLIFIVVTRDENNCILPLGFALHRRKETNDYRVILEAFGRIYRGSLRPFVAKMDGELAIHNAARQVFDCLIRQCCWHSSLARTKRFPVKYTRGLSDLGIAISDRVVLDRSKFRRLGSTFDDDFRHLVNNSRDLEDFTTFSELLKESWSETENSYFAKHGNPLNQTLFSLAWFSDSNGTSNDAEGAFSNAKRDKTTNRNQRPSDFIGSSVRIATEANNNANALCIFRADNLWQEFGNAAFRGNGAAHYPGELKAFLKHCVSPYGQEMFLTYSDGFHFQIHEMELASARHEIQVVLVKLPTVAELVAGEGKFRATEGADHVFLHFLLKWLTMPCCPSPVALFKLHTEVTSMVDVFVAVFEEGAIFCTCGVPLREGHPCKHMILLFREKRIQIRPFWHFSNRLWSPAFHEKSLSEKLASVLNPAGSASKLVRTSNLMFVSPVHAMHPWRFVPNWLEHNQLLGLIGVKGSIRTVDPSRFVPLPQETVQCVLEKHYRTSGETAANEVAELLINLPYGPAKENLLGFLSATLRDGDDVSQLASDCRVVYQMKPRQRSWGRRWCFADALTDYRRRRARATRDPVPATSEAASEEEPLRRAPSRRKGATKKKDSARKKDSTETDQPRKKVRSKLVSNQRNSVA